MAHSRSFLANQKARNAIVGAENLLNCNLTTTNHQHLFVLFKLLKDLLFIAAEPERSEPTAT